MSDKIAAQITDPDLVALSHKTGLVIRPIDPIAVNRLFDELERYDSKERAETFAYLKGALNDTRSAIGAQPAYRNE